MMNVTLCCIIFMENLVESMEFFVSQLSARQVQCSHRNIFPTLSVNWAQNYVMPPLTFISFLSGTQKNINTFSL